jgi:hypothetical protein
MFFRFHKKLPLIMGVELDDDLVAHVERLIANLDELGLVLSLS